MAMMLMFFFGLQLLMLIDAQQFLTPAVANVDKFGNRTQSVDFVWTYTGVDLSATKFSCGITKINIIFKAPGATATVQGAYVGRADVIDDTTSTPFRIGFKLRNLAFSDANNYFCSLTVTGTPPVYSNSYVFKIYERPVFINCLADGLSTENGVNFFALREGGVLNSTCTVYGNPVPSLVCATYDIANRQQFELTSRNTNYTAFPLNNRMLIYSVQRAVTKVRCVADGGPTGRVTLEQIVRVDYPPNQPLFTASTTTPLNGSSVTLTCRADAKPAPKYRFVYVRHGFFLTTVQDGTSATYTIPEVNNYGAYRYKKTFRCVPHNYLGEARYSSLTFDIQVRPLVICFWRVTATEGQTAKFRCSIILANPKPTFIWRDSKNNIISNKDGTVLISSVARNQSGVYTCMISNGVGKPIIKSTTLTVNYGPEMKQNDSVMELCVTQRLSFSCQATGNPKPSMRVYFNGSLVSEGNWYSDSVTHTVPSMSNKDFGTYICQASNSVKKINRTIIVRRRNIPDGVSNIKCLVEQNSVVVMWALPACKANIKKIRIDYRGKGDKFWHSITVTTITERQLTISHLEAGNKFEVRVVIVDINGTEYFPNKQTGVTGFVTVSTNTSTSSQAVIALSVLMVICILIIVIVVVWNLKLRALIGKLKGHSDGPQRNAALDQQTGPYTDLRLDDISRIQQPYEGVTHPHAYEKHVNTFEAQYMEVQVPANHGQVNENAHQDYEVMGSEI